MRKIIILFSFILFSINFSTAQVCDKINCEDVKNFINVKIIEETVKTYPNVKSLEEYFKKNTLATPLNYSEFASILNSNNFSETRVKLGDVINSIKIKPEYTKEEFASKIMEEVASKLSEKQKTACNFGSLKIKLINDIDTYLDEKITDTFVEDGTSTGQDSSDVVFKQTDSNQSVVVEKPSFFSFSNLNLFTLLGILLPLILFFILFKNTNELYAKNERRKKDIEEIKQTPISNQSAYNRTQMSMSEFEILLSNSKVFREFHEAVENIQKQSPVNVQQPIVSINQASNQAPISSSNNSNVFYIKSPVENYFSANYSSPTKENTLYRFFPKPNKNEAEYEIHTEGGRIDDIISMVEKNIKPACDEENNPSNNTRNIKILKKGLVSLEGDKWIIKQKALIRYE
jgi:hypothetical protein